MDIHKINNLLSTIMGYADIMRHQVEDEQHKKWLTEIVVSSKGIDWLMRSKDENINYENVGD